MRSLETAGNEKRCFPWGFPIQKRVSPKAKAFGTPSFCFKEILQVEKRVEDCQSFDIHKEASM
ncbi:hypothetical protein ABMB67_001152 [Halalkalibacter oceani]